MIHVYNITHNLFYCVQSSVTMAQKLVSDYWSLTVKELKSEIQNTRHWSVSGSKKTLIYRLIYHDRIYRNIDVVFDNTHNPKKSDGDFGFVSNIPWEFQRKICQGFAEEIRRKANEIYWNIGPVGKDDETLDNTSSQNARQEFKNILKRMMASWVIRDADEFMYETLLYCGNNHIVSAADLDSWVWSVDEQGRVFDDIIVEKIIPIWEESIRKYKKERRIYNNDQWAFDAPFESIAIMLEQLVDKRIEKCIYQKKYKNIMKSTFLYGCAFQNSGSNLLPLIGARYAYETVRRQVAEYVGAIDA